jgi:penicillin amidase
MAELLGGNDRVTPEALMALQRDVRSPSARTARDAILARVREAAGTAWNARAILAAWDGAYTEDSRGALAFEAVFAELAPRVFRATGRQKEMAWLSQTSFARQAFLRALAEVDDRTLAPMLTAAFARADDTLKRHGAWGDIHRLQLNHQLAELPLGGAPYRFVDLPSGGSNETLMKAAHGLKSEPGRVRYGAQARHVSDMSDPDANWFVLLGGQDGWFNSSTFLDQVPLWREGRYVRMPLEAETVLREFPHAIVLEGRPRTASLP